MKESENSKLVLRIRDTGDGCFMRYQWRLEEVFFNEQNQPRGGIQINYGYAHSARRAEKKGRRAATKETLKRKRRSEWMVQLPNESD